MARWKRINNFPDYSVSDKGDIRNDRTDRILSQSQNQSGVMHVGLMMNGIQYHRSVALLVAKAFLPNHDEPYDTPINLNGDRTDNHVDNLRWRPRWYAIKYNQQFYHPYPHHIANPVYDIKTGVVSNNSFECACQYGLLEEEVVKSILYRTYAWPTYQEFAVLEV